jgi:exosome complex RNA-binding protein Rrp42 (RNase PH superfamily)
MNGGDQPAREASSWGLLDKKQMPVSLTCGIFAEALIVDLTDEEEQLMQSTINISLESRGRLVGELSHPLGEMILWLRVSSA